MPDANDTIATNDLSTLAATHISRSVTALDLSGGGQTDVIVLHTERAAIMDKLTIMYTEGSAAGNCLLEVGDEGNADEYYTGNSVNAQAQWVTADLTKLQTAIAAGDTVVCGCAGGSGAVGEIIVIIEYRFSGGL